MRTIIVLVLACVVLVGCVGSTIPLHDCVYTGDSEVGLTHWYPQAYVQGKDDDGDTMSEWVDVSEQTERRLHDGAGNRINAGDPVVEWTNGGCR